MATVDKTRLLHALEAIFARLLCVHTLPETRSVYGEVVIPRKGVMIRNLYIVAKLIANLGKCAVCQHPDAKKYLKVCKERVADAINEDPCIPLDLRQANVTQAVYAFVQLHRICNGLAVSIVYRGDPPCTPDDS